MITYPSDAFFLIIIMVHKTFPVKGACMPMIKDMTQDQITLYIIKALKENKRKEFDAIQDELHPYDNARIYETLPEKHRTRFLQFLKIDAIADLLQELEKEEQIDVLNRLGIEKSGEVLDEMDNDDLALLLEELSPEKITSLLSEMKKEESTAVQNIMKYPPETAGTLDDITASSGSVITIAQFREAVDKLKSFADFAETLSYLYVIDHKRKLVGSCFLPGFASGGTGRISSAISCMKGLFPYRNIPTRKKWPVSLNGMTSSPFRL